MTDQLYHKSKSSKVIRDYVCSVCWSSLTAWYHDVEFDLVACARYPEEHRGYHSKVYVEKVRQEDAALAIDAKHALEKVGVLENPHAGKSTKELLSELGF